MELFSKGRLLRGNLHTHTTRSDGTRTPEEVCALYRSRGYDFLALTDHDLYTPGGAYEGMLLLSGAELAYNDIETRRAYHFVSIGANAGLGDFDDPKFGKNPQNIIDHIRRNNGYCILAHPAWSLLSHDDALRLEGYDAMEVMNTVSDPGARGDSSAFADVLMARGRPLPLIASDDAHFYNGDECRSWIMLDAPSCTENAVMAALRAGRFYATEGPQFRSIRYEDGVIHAECSPVSLIRFMSDSFYTSKRRHMCHMTPSSASYEVQPLDRFVRVECVDTEGRRAWSSFIDVRR